MPGTVNSNVYVEQGGNRLVVAPGGELALQGKLTGFLRGNAYFVDSVAGLSSNDGTTWAKAVATINQAVALCTADQGDTIFVAPKHAETIIAASGVLLNKAGISVVGVGIGRQRPIITFTTDVAASFDITSARVSVENLVFINGIDAQTAMINTTAADTTIRGCEIQTGDASTQTLLGILGNVSDRLRIEGNHIHGLVTAGTTSQIQLIGGDSVVIRDNFIVGACALTGNIKSLTTATLNFGIINNTILNQTADGNNLCINMQSTATGLIARNSLAVIDSTGPMPVVAAGAFVAGNYFTGAVSTTASTLL